MFRLLSAAMLVSALCALPAASFAADQKPAVPGKTKSAGGEVDKFGMPMKTLRSLQKKHKCVDIVRYREIIPYFGMEKTKEVSKQIAIGVEQKDIDAGIAKLVDVQYDCFQILGNFYVNCTTDVTLCYTKKKP